jgi:putative chitinase
MNLDHGRIGKLYPDAPEAHRSAFAEQAGELFERYGIGRNPVRLNFFLAQMGHESAGLTVVEEDLSYSAVRLTQIWPTHFPTVSSARLCARNPACLADRLHGGRMGNRPEGSGDGWRFRGRGYFQLAGRDAYTAIGEATDLDLIGEPDLAAQPETALLVACGFWSWKGLNAVCDTGDFDKVTSRLTGSIYEMPDRRRWLGRVRQVLAECATCAEPAPRLDIAA